MLPDEQIIEAVVSGDQTAFASLVDKYKRMAFNVAFRILKNESEAEEAAMDAFVKVYRNLKNFDHRSKFSTWFYRIVTNESLGRARKKKHEMVDLSSAHHLGELDGGSGENAKLVRTAINALGEKDAEVLTLYYLKELSLAEIGEMLGVEPNTIKVNVHRARKKLAATMLDLIGHEVYELLED